MGQADRIREGLSGAAAVLGGPERSGSMRRGADVPGSGDRCPWYTDGRSRTGCDARADRWGATGSDPGSCLHSHTDADAGAHPGFGADGHARSHRHTGTHVVPDTGSNTGTHRHAVSNSDTGACPSSYKARRSLRRHPPLRRLRRLPLGQWLS